LADALPAFSLDVVKQVLAYMLHGTATAGAGAVHLGHAWSSRYLVLTPQYVLASPLSPQCTYSDTLWRSCHVFCGADSLVSEVRASGKWIHTDRTPVATFSGIQQHPYVRSAIETGNGELMCVLARAEDAPAVEKYSAVLHRTLGGAPPGTPSGVVRRFGHVHDAWHSCCSTTGQFGKRLAAAAGGVLFLVDRGGCCIRAFDLEGAPLCEFGRRGCGDGEFLEPYGITAFGDEVFVSDVAQHRIQVFTHQGKFVRKFGEKGHGFGQLDEPAGLAVDRVGQLFVCDRNNHRVQVLDRSGAFVTHIGDDNPVNDSLNRPCLVCITYDGTVRVVDELHVFRLSEFVFAAHP